MPSFTYIYPKGFEVHVFKQQNQTQQTLDEPFIVLGSIKEVVILKIMLTI